MGQYDKTLYEGKQISRRQRQAIKFVSEITDKRYNLLIHLYQGSWRPETSYSGTTHTNAGVVDAYVYGMSSMSDEKLQEITRILRREGRQAAFLRGPFVDMPWHWHICDVDTTRMDGNAVWQVEEYRKGNDGLTSGHSDPFPYRPRPIKKWNFKE